MTNNQDARPFVDLQKDAEEFQAKFEEDIEKCKSILDAKITALICDPDSLGHSVGPKQNALVEFSKAKYDIYISMKSLMNDMEREWLKYISEMKKLFIDNVEVFLANTKLEVKLPSGYQPSPVTKKSPSVKKPAAVTSSIYPIISTITKSIPVFSPKNKLMDFEALTDETEMDLNTSWASSRCRKSIKFDNSSIDINKSWSSSRQNSKLNERVDLGSSPVLSAENGISDDEDTDEENPSSSHVAANGQKNHSPSQNLKRNSLRGMSPKHISSSESQEETRELKSELPLANSRKSIRASSRSKSAVITKKSSTTSDESEDSKEAETNDNYVSLKGRRGQQVPKKQAKTKSGVVTIRASSRSKSAVITRKSSTTSDESEDSKETETNDNCVSLKGRRGQQVSQNQAKTKTLEQDEKISKAVHEELAVTSSTSKTRRGRSAAAKNVKGIAALEPERKEEAASEEKLSVTSVVSETRKGRSAAAKSAAKVSDKSAEMTGRSARRRTVNERVMETETSLLPNTVTFASKHDTDDDLDLYTPVARPSKSIVRRKTVLPNLEEVISGPDVIPGNRISARSKRKTISGVTDLASVAPSKRLKSSSTQKNDNVFVEDEGAADYNLLETNDGYSEWITLKSIDGKIPTSPAVYEVKVWRAKKTAYIGCCDSLRQKLTLHKLRQNSGHKHLDKFIERNYDDIQIRYEIVSSINEAKDEVKNRVNSFVAQHKTTPAYN